MDVYEYEKDLLTRLEESTEVLNWGDGNIPASRILSEWAYYIECQIEPTGWQALWKIPRVICEELKIKYPMCVFGSVDQILFKELKAVFSVLAVDDDDIQLPETHEVNLFDLWPTKSQENEVVDIENTANCIDKLRFFHNHIWMPWDNDCDDDVSWTEKRLELRIHFYYDIKRKDMKRALSAHIRTLITEARYIQSRREYLEIGLSDDEDMSEAFDKTQITDLMRLHLRLNMIKSELEMLENPEMRKIYEEIMFDNEKYLKHALNPEKKVRYSASFDKTKVYIVTKPYSFADQLKYLEVAKQFIDAEKVVQMCPSLQHVLDFCNASDQIYLPPGPHFMKFLEYLNDSGLICGLTPDIKYNTKEKFDLIPDVSDVVIMSQDDESIILIFDGNFILKNLIIDCRNARLGILVKNGNIEFNNCLVIGDGKSSTRQGIVVSGNSKLHLENCLIKNFSVGVSLRDEAHLNLKASTIYNCINSVEVQDGTKVEFENASIINAESGIYFSTKCLNNKVEKRKIIYNELDELQDDLCESLPWTGNCTFENTPQNIVVNNKQTGLSSTRVEYLLSDSMENVRYSSYVKRENESDRNESDQNESNENESDEIETSMDDSEIISIEDSVVEID